MGRLVVHLTDDITTKFLCPVDLTLSKQPHEDWSYPPQTPAGQTQYEHLKRPLAGCHISIMKLRQLFDDSENERGVSPVIGVILMVAITVILAAVIGTFVLGLGDNVNSTPQASWDFEEDGGDVIITHNGGDTINGDRLSVTGAADDDSIFDSDTVTAGSSATVSGPTSGETLRLVYTAEGGDSSNVIATYEVS